MINYYDLLFAFIIVLLILSICIFALDYGINLFESIEKSKKMTGLVLSITLLIGVFIIRRTVFYYQTSSNTIIGSMED